MYRLSGKQRRLFFHFEVGSGTPWGAARLSAMIRAKARYWRQFGEMDPERAMQRAADQILSNPEHWLKRWGSLKTSFTYEMIFFPGEHPNLDRK